MMLHRGAVRLSLAILVSALSGCVGATEREIALPLQPEGASLHLTALARGVLVADDSRTCVYLRDDGGGLTWLVWPPGYRAIGDPFEIRDSTGQTVAREGDAVELGGGMGPAPDGPCALAPDSWTVDAIGS